MKKSQFFSLIVIFLVALFLRVWQLDLVPIELFGDEIDAGLQANSILKTGQDYYGQNWPVMFHSFSEYRLPLFIYSDVPFIAIFGLNAWGVRLNDVFWSIIGILGIYLLTRKLFNEKVGLLASFLLAISPWHIQYARQGGIESGMLLTFIIFGVWTFLKGLDNFKWLVLAAVIFSLSIYVYATAVLFVPLLLAGLIGLNFKRLKQIKVNQLIMMGIIGLVILFPYLNLTFQNKSQSRFSSISIFQEKELIDDLFLKRRAEAVDPLVGIWHNKPEVFAKEFVLNYSRSLSAEFLFMRGDGNLRQSVGDRGELYLFEIFLIILGFYYSRKFPKERNMLIAWLLLAPIPASLTEGGGYHASRLMLLLLPLEIISALGLYQLVVLIKFRKTQIAACLIVVLALFNIGNFLHRYFIDYPKDSFRFWQAGYKEAMNYVKENEGSYKRVFINNTYEPALPRFLFWSNYDPVTFKKQFDGDYKRFDVMPGFDGFSLTQKYYFGTVSNTDTYSGLDKLIQKGDLYMVSTRDEAIGSDWRVTPPGSIQVLKTITDPFDKPIFFIVTRK